MYFIYGTLQFSLLSTRTRRNRWSNFYVLFTVLSICGFSALRYLCCNWCSFKIWKDSGKQPSGGAKDDKDKTTKLSKWKKRVSLISTISGGRRLLANSTSSRLPGSLSESRLYRFIISQAQYLGQFCLMSLSQIWMKGSRAPSVSLQKTLS